MKRKLLLFDLGITGHHSIYIRHILEHWEEEYRQLVVVVSPDFLQQHQEIVQMEVKGEVVWLPVTSKEIEWYESCKQSLLRHTWVEWRLFCRYAKKIKAAHALIMYIDRFQLPLALRMPTPCTLSGIYFRPKFHYANLPNYQFKKGDALRFLREKCLWYSALRHTKLTKLFCLDRLSVNALNSLNGIATVHPLPDPIELPKFNLEIAKRINRKTLDIQQNRLVLLIFGALDQRKGIYQVLEAMKLLTIAQQKQLTLLLIGRVVKAEKERFYDRTEELNNTSAVQIILKDEFIPESDLLAYFELTDSVLTLYQQHVGSSGLLLWAAATGKPVLSSNYGLLGATVNRYKLGLTVDSTSPIAIKGGLEQLIDNQLSPFFNKKEAKKLALSNTPIQFTNTLLSI